MDNSYNKRGAVSECSAPSVKEASQRAGGSLFIDSVISSHHLSDYIHNQEVFDRNPLVKELVKLNYSINSINSMLKCGTEAGMILRSCSPGCSKNKVLNLTHHCSLRTCPECSKIRKRRLFNQYYHYLKSLKIDSTNNFYFLNIAPKNYDTLEEGMMHIRKSFSKFLRHKYIKERIKGGIWIIETKNVSPDGSSKGWHVHLHVIFYGRRLDNYIRGECLDCGKKGIMKYDYNTKKFSCMYKKCLSKNVVIIQDSKIVRIWKKCSDRDGHIYIPSNYGNRYSTTRTLNYVLKYVSANKDDFLDIKSLAVYICSIRKRKLINTFGEFFKNPPKKHKPSCFCSECGEKINYLFNIELIGELALNHPNSSYLDKQGIKVIKEPPDMLNGTPEIEYVKI